MRHAVCMLLSGSGNAALNKAQTKIYLKDEGLKRAFHELRRQYEPFTIQCVTSRDVTAWCL